MAAPETSARSFFEASPFKNSIASQLFLVVFLIYLAIALAIASSQIIEIYTRAKSDLTRELEILGSSFKGSLAKALWEFDEESLNSSIQGLQDIPGVLGVSVMDINTGVMHTAGVGQKGDAEERQSNRRANDPNLIRQEFDVVFNIDGRNELVGRATVYSDTDVVIERIKYSVLVVILSEVLKIIAMWAVFLWVSHRMLRQPLAVLTTAAERLSKEDLKDFKVDINAKSQNELTLLEEAFNISAEKLSEAKDELENRMRLALSAGRIATWVWHPKEDRLEFDDHLPSIFGQSPEAFGQSFRELQRFINIDDRSSFIMLMNNAVASRKPLHTDFQVDALDGSAIHIEVQAIISYSSDSPDTPYLVGTAMDVTDRRKADEELQLAKAAAEQANSAKSNFLASMSHELRTPLNAILGFSDVLKEQYFGPIGVEKYREYANDIHNSGNYLLELVDELLDLSAIEAGKTKLHKEPTRIEEVVDDCIRTVAEKAIAKDIRLTFEPPSDLPPALVDKRAVKQVVLNILSNAVKFTQTGGSIEIVADCQNDCARIVVTDNGQGIADDQLSVITTPFTRGDNPHYAVDRGWGLGLAISRTLVELHDGEILIDSELDKGTTVTIILPLGD